jgi:hypothetical protein
MASQNPIKVHAALQALYSSVGLTNPGLSSTLLKSKQTYRVETVTPEQEKLFQADATRRWNKQNDYQTFSGTDIQAIMYLPLLTKSSFVGRDTPKFKIFADLQTISISSTRSVSPVRVFGRSSPINYTRGARTFAGTLVFATIKKDPFIEVADAGVGESAVNASTSLIADQLPPFSVVVVGCNELGTVAAQVIHGITITNYGTTYSVDDLYTETTYTYVATDVTPLSPDSASFTARQKLANNISAGISYFTSLTDLVSNSLQTAYGTVEELYKKAMTIKDARQTTQLDPYGLAKRHPDIGN